MKISVLERILVAERMRHKASFAPPIANRRASTMEEGPWFVTNTKGAVVLTHLQKDAGEEFVLQAFVDCPIDEEDPVVSRLYATMWATSKRLGWNNRCSSLSGSVQRMLGLGYDAKFLIVPYADLKGVCGSDLSEEEAERLTLVNGCVAEVQEVKILISNGLPEGAAILTATPSLTGHYLRSYDHLSIMVNRANRAILLVGPDAVD